MRRLDTRNQRAVEPSDRFVDLLDRLESYETRGVLRGLSVGARVDAVGPDSRA